MLVRAAEVEIIFYWLGTVVYDEKTAAKTCEFQPLSKDVFAKINELNDDIFCAFTGNYISFEYYISCLGTS